MVYQGTTYDPAKLLPFIEEAKRRKDSENRESELLELQKQMMQEDLKDRKMARKVAEDEREYLEKQRKEAANWRQQYIQEQLPKEAFKAAAYQNLYNTFGGMPFPEVKPIGGSSGGGGGGSSDQPKQPISQESGMSKDAKWGTQIYNDMIGGGQPQPAQPQQQTGSGSISSGAGGATATPLPQQQPQESGDGEIRRDGNTVVRMEEPMPSRFTGTETQPTPLADIYSQDIGGKAEEPFKKENVKVAQMRSAIESKIKSIEDKGKKESVMKEYEKYKNNPDVLPKIYNALMEEEAKEFAKAVRGRLFGDASEELGKLERK